MALAVGSAARVGYAALVTAHVPTGRVALQDVLRLAITDLGTRPQRDDWRQILDETQSAYEMARS